MPESEFDFDEACRDEGRNETGWVSAFRSHLSYRPLPETEYEQREIVRRANKATGGLNQAGERERYTLYELQQTIEQVKRYAPESCGVRALTENRRRWARKTRKPVPELSKQLLEAICDVADRRSRWKFYISYRDMAKMIGADWRVIRYLLDQLIAAKQVFYEGQTKPFGKRKSGTTILSLRPPEPAQNFDEIKRPVFDYKAAKWKWNTPLEKGNLNTFMCRKLARQGLAVALAANVPYVFALALRGERIPTPSGERASAFSSRGSP